MRGYAYVIRSHRSPLKYYGSTIQQLSQRLAGHHAAQKQYLAGKGTWCSSFEILALGDYYIELVRVVDFEVKAELHAVEGELIRTNDCVNKNQAGRTPAQHYLDNRAEIRAQQAAYNAAHVEENRAYQATYKAANAAKINEKNTCGCGGKFTTCHKAAHIKTAKHKAWLAAAAAE